MKKRQKKKMWRHNCFRCGKEYNLGEPTGNIEELKSCPRCVRRETNIVRWYLRIDENFRENLKKMNDQIRIAQFNEQVEDFSDAYMRIYLAFWDDIEEKRKALKYRNHRLI